MSNVRLHAFAAFAGDKGSAALAALADVQALALRSLKAGDRAGALETSADLLALKGKAKTGGAMLHALNYALELAQKGQGKVKAYALPEGVKGDSRDGKAAVDVVNRIGLEMPEVVGLLGMGKGKDLDRAEILAGAVALHVIDALAVAWPAPKKKEKAAPVAADPAGDNDSDSDKGDDTGTPTDSVPAPAAAPVDAAVHDAVKAELVSAQMRIAELEAELLALRKAAPKKAPKPAAQLTVLEVIDEPAPF